LGSQYPKLNHECICSVFFGIAIANEIGIEQHLMAAIFDVDSDPDLDFDFDERHYPGQYTQQAVGVARRDTVSGIGPH
jgi:hypothetical protein